MDKKRKRFSIDCGDGRTQQNFRAQCDINTIVEKLQRTGLVSHFNAKKPMFGDVSSIPDYQSALAIVNSARDSFLAHPAKVRERFSNDPARMVAFIADPDNRDEAIKLGLMVKKEAVPPVVPPAPPAAGAPPAK